MNPAEKEYTEQQQQISDYFDQIVKQVKTLKKEALDKGLVPVHDNPYFRIARVTEGIKVILIADVLREE